MFWGSGTSKSRLAKAAGAEPLVRWEMKNCTLLWREAHVKVQVPKTSKNNQKHLIVRTRLEAEMSKKCTLWREAHFHVKSIKNWRSRGTFGNWDVEKVTPLWHEAHLELNMLKTLRFGAGLEVELSKKCTLWRACFHVKSIKNWRSRGTFGNLDVEKVTPLWREAHLELNMLKTLRFGAGLEAEMSKKCTLWREANFHVKSIKTWRSRGTFGNWDVEKVARNTLWSQPCYLLTVSEHSLAVRMQFYVGGAMDSARCQKVSDVSEICGFSAVATRMAGVGHRTMTWEEAFRVERVVQETRSSEMLGGQGADFLRWVAFWSIRSSDLLINMILRETCSTLYDLASLSRGKRDIFDRWGGKIAKRIGTRLSDSTFH